MQETKLKNVMQRNDFLEKYWLLIFTILFVVVSASLEPSFIRIGNLSSMLSTSCLTAVAAAGLVCVQAIGELDFLNRCHHVLVGQPALYLARPRIC